MHTARSRLGAIAIATALATLVVISYFAYRDWKQYGVAFAKRNEARQILTSMKIFWVRCATRKQASADFS